MNAPNVAVVRDALRSRIEAVAVMTCVTRQGPLGSSALKMRDAVAAATDAELVQIAPQIVRAIDMAGRFIRTEGGIH